MQEFAGKPVRALVVWEPVLLSDWFPPSTTTLSRVTDSRATQFWDKDRLVSHFLGEHDSKSIVWDYIAVYPAESFGTSARPMLPITEALSST